MLEHEEVIIRSGARSGLPIIIAVHSTALGEAAGGCRMWSYEDWRAGLTDALALSEAMTFKCAAAGLDHGGGKSVIVLPPGTALTGTRRRQALLDFGDAVQSLGGRYHAGEDVGTTAEDMWIARERTSWVHCLPVKHGGSGEPSELTAIGTLAAIEATWQHVAGASSLAGRHVTVVGLGQVGGRLARLLAEKGARLTVADIDPTRAELARSLGARWVDPATAMTTETDILVPAALGGILSRDVVSQLRCAAVVGPANNQLGDPSVADVLDAQGILWAPDFVVNAGGVIHGAIIDFGGGTVEEAAAAARRIGPRLADIYRRAVDTDSTPHAVATRLAHQRVAHANERRIGISLSEG
jgi:leucine dehydrogenase